jgi:multicomponent Na+:H+ antiporter subunit F
MSFLSWTLAAVGILGLLVIVRTWLAESTWDRLLGLSMLSAKIIAAMALLAVMMNRSYYLDIGLVFSVLGFSGNILLARFVQRRGNGDENGSL